MARPSSWSRKAPEPVLRAMLVGVGTLALIFGAGALARGGPPPLVVGSLALGLMLTLGVIYERVRYKALASRRAGPGWQRTEERFIDPESGKRVTVYFRPSDGERMYVEE